MKHAIDSRVKVVKATDDSFDQSYMGMEGIVIGHNDNEQTGNTKKDPLHNVKFDLNTVPPSHSKYEKDAYIVSSFWHEELKIVNP